jgi:hypothetical protein
VSEFCAFGGGEKEGARRGRYKGFKRRRRRREGRKEGGGRERRGEADEDTKNEIIKKRSIFEGRWGRRRQSAEVEEGAGREEKKREIDKRDGRREAEGKVRTRKRGSREGKERGGVRSVGNGGRAHVLYQMRERASERRGRSELRGREGQGRQ